MCHGVVMRSRLVIAYGGVIDFYSMRQVRINKGLLFREWWIDWSSSSRWNYKRSCVQPHSYGTKRNYDAASTVRLSENCKPWWERRCSIE